jgi:hypothetical protein
MIERLKESFGGVLGLKVVGKLTSEDIKSFEPQIEIVISERKHKPIGLLADHHIARMAVVGADKWEEIAAMVTAGAAILEAETRYFDESEILRAWEWVRTAKYAEDMPVRQISAGTGIWKDYHPEYMDIGT